jgi:hypothetical protein
VSLPSMRTEEFVPWRKFVIVGTRLAGPGSLIEASEEWSYSHLSLMYADRVPPSRDLDKRVVFGFIWGAGKDVRVTLEPPHRDNREALGLAKRLLAPWAAIEEVELHFDLP